MMNHSLQDKVAIVTGAGRGHGAAIAKALAQVGARVAVNDLNPDRAEGTAAGIRQAGYAALGVPADVSNKFQCVNLVESTRRAWGRLDILVNNAAIRPSSTILKMDEWAWQRCLDVNLKGVFFMSQLVGRVMADENRERGGLIINITSTAGFQVPAPSAAAYAASKAGVIGFTRECAREFAAYNVRVYALVSTPDQAATSVADAVLTLCSEAAHGSRQDTLYFT